MALRLAGAEGELEDSPRLREVWDHLAADADERTSHAAAELYNTPKLRRTPSNG